MTVYAMHSAGHLKPALFVHYLCLVIHTQKNLVPEPKFSRMFPSMKMLTLPFLGNTNPAKNQSIESKKSQKTFPTVVYGWCQYNSFTRLHNALKIIGKFEILLSPRLNSLLPKIRKDRTREEYPLKTSIRPYLLEDMVVEIFENYYPVRFWLVSSARHHNHA